MPYAPGVSYRAGDYFASLGPQISQNIQTWQKNNDERQQALASAEMIGRYLKDDPQAVQMFGENLAKVPSMSTGAAKALLGSATMYLTQRHLKAAEDAQTAQTDVAKQELAIRAGEAARKTAAENRFADFNQRIDQEVNPPLMFKSAEGAGPGPISPETIARLAAQAGVWGQPETTGLFNAISSYQGRIQGLPRGTVQELPGGHQLIGLGTGVQPHFLQAKDVKGFDFGVPKETPEGTLIGMGVNSEPKFISNADKSKPTPLDQGFMMFSPVFAHQLDSADAAIDKYGKGLMAGLPLTDPVGRATLQQLPTLLATSYAKVTDPSGVVRDSDIKLFTDKLFPQGTQTRASVTKAAIENLRNDLAVRVHAWGANQKEVGKIPGGMPDWIATRVKGISDSAAGAAAIPGSAQVAVISKDGRRGMIPADQLDAALKEGYRRAE